MSRKPMLKVVVAILITIVVVMGIKARITQVNEEFDDDEWNLERIENILDVAVPQNAEDLVYQGTWGRLTHLKLSFKAPPAAVDNFASHLCYGKLYQHYDPFNSLSFAYPIDNPRAATLYAPYIPYAYYSYSPNSTDTLFGTQCLIEGPTVIKILVDKSNSDIYTLRLEYNLGGAIPGLFRALADSPLIFAGFDIKYEEPIRLARYSKFCLDIDPAKFTAMREDYMRTPVQITLDNEIGNEILPPAYISANGFLTGVHSGEEADKLFSYCYDASHLKNGRYVLTIRLTSHSNHIQEYHWSFLILR